MFQSVLMFFGVMVLLFASLHQAGGLENATRTALKNTGPGYVYGPGYDDKFEGPKAAPNATTARGWLMTPPSRASFCRCRWLCRFSACGFGAASVRPRAWCG